MQSTLLNTTDILIYLVEYTSAQDAVSLSSTCRQIRSILRPHLFSSCYWKVDAQPPQTLWPLIRHLHIQPNTDSYLYFYDFLQDLSGLDSLHVNAEYISNNVAYVIATATRLRTLDMAYLSWRAPRDSRPTEHQLLYNFPPVACQPQVVKFCSRLDDNYSDLLQYSYANKMRAERFTFASLLHELDVSQVEVFEVGAEALCLPVAVAYTWSSLRELVLTGVWVHPEDDYNALEDPRLAIPASAFQHVYLGTLLLSAPRLRTLRVRCRFAEWFSHPQCVVWPPGERAPPCGSAVPSLDELELCNPSATDGIYEQLPSTLTALSLVNWPHKTYMALDPDDPEEVAMADAARDPQETLTSVELLSVLRSAAPLPTLRRLCLSFRGTMDLRLMRHIATSYMQLEVLELHGEWGDGSVWSAHDLMTCIRALIPLKCLRVLQLNTFHRIHQDSGRNKVSRPRVTKAMERDRKGIPLWFMAEALFGRRHGGAQGKGKANGLGLDIDQDSGEASERFPVLQQVWLPWTFSDGGRRSYNIVSREWRVYHVDRHSDGRALDLRADTGPGISMVDTSG